MPISDEQSRTLGRLYTSGKECYPCVITTGDMLRKINSPEFDRDSMAFFMPTAYGPCRFGQYCRFHRMLLDDLGYDDVPMVLLDQTQEYYKDAEKLGTDFRRLAWRGVVFVDTLQKMLREIRPYEVVKGGTDEVYLRYLHKCAEVTEERGDLAPLAREARRAFEAIEVDRSQPRPLIGIVGEIFVRSNEFVNNFIVRKIESFGGETIMPPFEEWINYIGWSRKREARKQSNWKLMATEKITEMVQRYEKRKVLREFQGAIRGSLEEPRSEEVIRLARDYLDPSVRGGETVLSLGRSMEYVHANCDGIVNLHPFNCMPGSIVNAILTRLQKDHDIPVLKVAYDGQEQSNELIRIEAFVHQ
ncbi:MAG: CoA activase, partial [Candidatus Eisenbacteria sp.]|nr:CoA activase [Candidatus Eisenbacteria bacterium]